MNSLAAAALQPAPRHIKLLRYQPRPGDAGRCIGALWQDGQSVRWTSVIACHPDHEPDATQFIARFPESGFAFDHFASALAWLSTVCSHAGALPDVAKACRSTPELGLSCLRHEGSDHRMDLQGLLDTEDQTGLLDGDLLQHVVELSLEHLVQDHPVLRGLPLAFATEGSREMALLSLPDHRQVHVYFDRDTRPLRVVPLLLAESNRLFHSRRDKEVSFFVFAQLRSALPLRLTDNVLATGMRLPHIANGLVRLVWATPLLP
ncbi:hypothetical protein RCH10_004943 [Variovorax sp. GrIS 2.14]|uniref:hypothetical protein n=1 Tax=Variovorax sp. GrIS 2.14 TaxID=3071709 RepID=UPI0038F658D3